MTKPITRQLVRPRFAGVWEWHSKSKSNSKSKSKSKVRLRADNAEADVAGGAIRRVGAARRDPIAAAI